MYAAVASRACCGASGSTLIASRRGGTVGWTAADAVVSGAGASAVCGSFTVDSPVGSAMQSAYRPRPPDTIARATGGLTPRRSPSLLRVQRGAEVALAEVR